MDRWVDLRIDKTYIPETVNMLMTPAPRLKRFSISSSPTTTLPAPLFADKIHHLRSLSLDNYAIPWRSQAVRSTSLQHLILSNFPPYSLELTTLFSMLASCPNIVLLSLRNVSLQSFGDSHIPPLIMVNLLHLDLDLFFEYVATILERLHLPSVINLTLMAQQHAGRVTSWARFQQILIAMSIRFIKDIPVADIPRAALQYSRGKTIMKIDSSRSFQFGASAGTDLLPLLSIIGDIPVALVFDSAVSLGQILTIHEMLQNNVTYLRLPVPNDCADLHGILDALFGIRHGRIAIFPKLRILDVEGSAFEPYDALDPRLLENFATLVKARRSSSNALLVQIRCHEVDVDERLRELSRRFPDSFIFMPDDSGVEWGNRPEVPLDLDHE